MHCTANQRKLQNMTSTELSKHTDGLSGIHKDRYLAKLRTIGFDDPYLLPKAMFDSLLTTASTARSIALPEIGYPDIYNYLVNQTSAYTSQDLKSYKSLDGYKYFVAGWVKEVLVKERNQVFLAVSKVMHSQALSEQPVSAWCAIRANGEIVCAHCTCMAGLGESCSHVAATLFTLETASRIKNDTTCTSVPCEWLVPTKSKNVEYQEIKNIDFTSPLTKKRKYCDGQSTQPIGKKTRTVNSDIDYQAFYDQLKDVGSVVLSVLPGYANNFVPKSVTNPLPKPLTECFSVENQTLSPAALSEKVKKFMEDWTITESEIKAVERHTREQASSGTWFGQRAGRVTASVFKAASRTNPDNPSVSLIKRICYPAAYKISNKATRWGCEHEEKVTKYYELIQTNKHREMKVIQSGLFIHKDYPFIGASPDGLISCSCCGDGVLEIKCPYCKKGSSIQDACSDRGCCLEEVGGHYQLKRDHQYFYQVQCQLACTGRSYADFCVWTDNELFIERITYNHQLFHDTVNKIAELYKRSVLPELLAKNVTASMTHDDNHPLTGQVCYCKDANSNKTLISCASDSCSTKFFHKECLGLKRQPKKGWLCTTCRLVAKRKL